MLLRIACQPLADRTTNRLELPNAEVVQNPFNVDYDVRLPWPQEFDDEIRFACVGRLYVPAKGQDILLEALAGPAWLNRRWYLTFYGEGSMKDGIGAYD